MPAAMRSWIPRDILLHHAMAAPDVLRVAPARLAMRKPASTDAATLSSHPLTLRRLARLLTLLAPKMEETVVLRRLDIHQNQVPSEKYSFDLDAIQRMEIYVLDSLNWRMQVVTPFYYINYFVDKFTGGKPLSCGFISRRTEIVLGSLEATKLLQFRPFEMAAVVLSAAAESQENVRICHEALQEVGLVKKKTDYTASPSRVLDASCFSFKTDDNQTAGSALTVLFASDICTVFVMRLIFNRDAQFGLFDGDGKLAKALDARPLTKVVKDLEAKMKGGQSS
uniref:Cyclin C-terminal domain-containing protein n=1 Tax=Zea mays TaxID=4577 RepID=A0A804Q3X2_MAIZE